MRNGYSPDWLLNNHSFGGKLKDIPKPYVRKFPNPHIKRQVDIEIYSWCTIGSIGAKHLYVVIKEEDNYIWNSINNCWQIATDDGLGKGKKIETNFIYGEQPESVREWIKKTLSKNFPKSLYLHNYKDSTKTYPSRRFYRDGD
jgi:hypothetical protein